MKKPDNDVQSATWTTFVFAPGEKVRVVMAGLDLKGQVVGCKLERGNLKSYDVEYVRDATVLCRADFFADQLAKAEPE